MNISALVEVWQDSIQNALTFSGLADGRKAVHILHAAAIQYFRRAVDTTIQRPSKGHGPARQTLAAGMLEHCANEQSSGLTST
jgi:hypothetical protein